MSINDLEEVAQTSRYVYRAIRDVSEELSHDGISKDRSNQQQNYKFRGIDDCLNALSSLLPKHNLVVIPSVLERECVERQTKSGGSLFYVTVKVKFSFVSILDGSTHDAMLYGEAMDSADKATNKAMSAAYKYCVLLTFCIPTEGENDADAVTHDVAPATTKTFAQKFPEQAKKIQEKLTQGDNGLSGVADAALTCGLQSKYAPASLLPAGKWIVPFGRDKGKPINDVSDEGLDYLLRYYNGKLQDPANTTSRYRDEWETSILEVRAELLARFPHTQAE
jgi:hypothetical protein